jgi:hypothetical protein
MIISLLLRWTLTFIKILFLVNERCGVLPLRSPLGLVIHHLFNWCLRSKAFFHFLDINCLCFNSHLLYGFIRDISQVNSISLGVYISALLLWCRLWYSLSTDCSGLLLKCVYFRMEIDLNWILSLQTDYLAFKSFRFI